MVDARSNDVALERALRIAKLAGFDHANYMVVGIPQDGSGASPRYARYNYPETANGTLEVWTADGDAAFRFSPRDLQAQR